ncbi:MAG: hypothetical protein ABFS43_08100 [Thermodesulfobacteriota bacterium]
MKVVNLLDGAEVDVECIRAIYTGPLQDQSDDVPQEPESFERSVPGRILPQELVLHEINLLQIGFTFWIKIDGDAGIDAVWVPARMDP